MLDRYPVTTIRDLFVVSAILAEVERGGRGAFRRVAARERIRLSLLTEALDRIEAQIGFKLLETGPSGRRRSVLSPVGDQFRFGASAMVTAWDRAMWNVREMASLEGLAEPPPEGRRP